MNFEQCYASPPTGLFLFRYGDEKEKIWAWRVWEIQGSEQQHQEVHKKG